MFNLILLVDDDPITNFINEKVLRKCGASKEISVQKSGQAALAYIENRIKNHQPCPDLIILDIFMPVMDGVEFLAAYQNLCFPDNGMEHSIVVLTTSDLLVERKKFVHPYIKDFIIKPLTKDCIGSFITKLKNRGNAATSSGGRTP